MKTAQLHESPTITDSNIIDRAFKSLIFKILKGISRGRLTITDGAETWTFGEDENNAQVKAYIHVHHPAAYRTVLSRGSIGSGEAYMRGEWSSPDLTQVIRIFVLNMSLLKKMDSGTSRSFQWINSLRHRLKRNNKSNAKQNISAHYDLGNDLYKLFLDKNMMYSSAIFTDSDSSLDTAAEHKLEKICQKLDLSASDHLLEIGSGWGGMAIYAAKTRGCKVTTVTISQQQYEYAFEWIRREGLQEKVEVLLKDYRDITGVYSKIVSIEMIEAVGHEYFDVFFKQCNRLLADDGKMLIQSITIADQRYEAEKNNADFIQTYIFPGGCLPSLTALCQSMTKASELQLVQCEEIGLHYAKTLSIWKKNFFHNIDAVKKIGYDNRFIRMWDFYLSYCEGGFLERVIGTSQLVFAKPGCKQLP